MWNILQITAKQAYIILIKLKSYQASFATTTWLKKSTAKKKKKLQKIQAHGGCNMPVIQWTTEQIKEEIKK